MNAPPYFLHYEHDPADLKSLSNNSVFSLLADRSGNLWMGTFGGGLNKLVPEEQGKARPAFIHFKNIPGKRRYRRSQKRSAHFDTKAI